MIKLIASDMDGTWLRDDKTYDHEMFSREFKVMQERDIKFVVASGNQFENLIKRFPENADRIYFVAENGALIAKGKELLHTDALSQKDYQITQEVVHDYPYPAVVEGLKSAYIRRSDGEDYYQEMHKYFAEITLVDDFSEVKDKIFKVNMTLPIEKTLPTIDELRKKYPEMGFVAGSADSIDMQTKGMNKAVGLEYLGKKFNISADEMVSFGDSGNDVGMLKYTGKSFATGTAMPEAKEAADEVIGTCNESAVQKEILKLLNIN
ncbi:Cof-type HAD-IIB family hydrolase [Lactobacillus hamsteri]|uniref:Sugar-phosphatase n=1 Tax=Lactobacillus hamsteri DSM 5661 = JCM 6256 TaxID=1423754 RepID=A0A0R1YDR4_9LACO|nr:Cof-type HAD-IIB family hydrolase [Lactobacillus hamsteri]KRM38059.1 sugar-phosphatase [Lactobacillus hamsteri DSM 5661 = JCM 6256]